MRTSELKASAATKTLVGPAWYHRPGAQPRPVGSCEHLRWSHRRVLTCPHKEFGARWQGGPGSLKRGCYHESLCLSYGLVQQKRNYLRPREFSCKRKNKVFKANSTRQAALYSSHKTYKITYNQWSCCIISVIQRKQTYFHI